MRRRAMEEGGPGFQAEKNSNHIGGKIERMKMEGKHDFTEDNESDPRA